MTTRWQAYIRSGVEAVGGPFPFALEQWRYHFPLFLAIRRAFPRGGRLLDVGCGAAVFTALLAHRGYETVGVDDDSDIVAYGAELARYFHVEVRVERANASDLCRYHGGFDLVYSIGVVEHFPADVTVQLIQEQARCAPMVAVVVPTKFTRYAAPVTDERLYRRGQVEALVRRAGLRVRESFVYGEVPSRLARNLERGLPGAVYRRLQHLCSYGMGIGVVGERQ